MRYRREELKGLKGLLAHLCTSPRSPGFAVTLSLRLGKGTDPVQPRPRLAADLFRRSPGSRWGWGFDGAETGVSWFQTGTDSRTGQPISNGLP